MLVSLYILRFLADFLNIFAREKYYDSFSSFKHNLSRFPFFYLASIVGEMVSFVASICLSELHGLSRAIFFILLNLIINFLLSLFYYNLKIISRFLVVISFQTIGLISEMVSGNLLSQLFNIFPDFVPTFRDEYIVVVSNIFSFLIVSIICAIHIKPDRKISLEHGLLICSTPVFSIFLLLTFPYTAIVSTESNFRTLFAIVIILSMNITNHILLNDITKQGMLKETIQNQNRQLSFQSEKFLQLSNAYKDTRSVIHEFKRYNSYILACIDNYEYENIRDFIQNSNIELEKRYVKINTGNLVIDTLMTNYESLSLENKIEYAKEIIIDKDDIPLNDYDLCIILGNLLDNSFDAASRWNNQIGSYNGFKIEVKILTKEKFFVVYVSNTFNVSENPTHNQYDLTHGYGIENVKNIVKKYSGVYFQKKEDGKYVTTVSIPILRDSFGMLIKSTNPA